MDRSAQLEQRLSEISERGFCAGWMDGLEFILWDVMLQADAFRYGDAVVTVDELKELSRLSQALEGWVYADDAGMVSLVSFERWEELRLERAALVVGTPSSS